MKFLLFNTVPYILTAYAYNHDQAYADKYRLKHKKCPKEWHWDPIKKHCLDCSPRLAAETA